MTSENFNVLNKVNLCLLFAPIPHNCLFNLAYFSRWWDQASALQRSQVRKFIAQGRFEFAVGGWVMPDEATTDYWSVIETMTLGHEFIYNTFGVRPRFGFQVDPFGASSMFAWQSAKFGFDAHIISRINYW